MKGSLPPTNTSFGFHLIAKKLSKNFHEREPPSHKKTFMSLPLTNTSIWFHLIWSRRKVFKKLSPKEASYKKPPTNTPFGFHLIPQKNPKTSISPNLDLCRNITSWQARYDSFVSQTLLRVKTMTEKNPILTALFLGACISRLWSFRRPVSVVSQILFAPSDLLRSVLHIKLNLNPDLDHVSSQLWVKFYLPPQKIFSDLYCT